MKVLGNSLALATLALFACGRPAAPPAATPVELPVAPAATAAAGVMPYTLEDLKMLGQRELNAAEGEIDIEFTPLRALDSGIFVHGKCQELSPGEEAIATEAIKRWKAAQSPPGRAADGEATISFGCVDSGETLAKVSWSVDDVTVDTLLRVGPSGVRELHRETGPVAGSGSADGADGAGIGAVFLDDLQPGQKTRDIVLKIFTYRVQQMDHPAAAEWRLIRNERPAVQVAKDFAMRECDMAEIGPVPVKWHSRIAVLCAAEKFFRPGGWNGLLLPSLSAITPPVSAADSVSANGVNRLLLRQAAAIELASLTGVPTTPADTAKLRLALGVLGQGVSALRRMGRPQQAEVDAVDKLWRTELEQHALPTQSNALPAYPNEPLSRDNKLRIVRALTANDPALATALLKEVGRDAAQCKFTLNPSSVYGLQWKHSNSIIAKVRWNLSGSAACRLSEKSILSREGVYSVSTTSVRLLTSIADAAPKQSEAQDSSAAYGEMLFGWARSEQNAFVDADMLWALSRDTRERPAAAVHQYLRADSADGGSALLPIVVKGRVREVGFRTQGGKLYAVDGLNLHILQNGSWAAPPAGDVFAAELRDKWELADLAKTLPKLPNGMTYDAAYARLGVPSNQRAAFFAADVK
jgi:hypothetical protein